MPLNQTKLGYLNLESLPCRDISQTMEGVFVCVCIYICARARTHTHTRERNIARIN